MEINNRSSRQAKSSEANDEFTLFKITFTINLPLGETENNMCQVCQLFRSVGHSSKSSNVMYQYDFKIRKFCRDTNGATLFIRTFCCFVLYKAEDIVNKKI